jgi:hypothetical protein
VINIEVPNGCIPSDGAHLHLKIIFSTLYQTQIHYLLLELGLAYVTFLAL